MTQREMVLDYMQTRGRITQLEAFNELWCSRLSPRIGELKKEGWDIDSDWEYRTNSYGQRKKWKSYWLKEDTQGELC